jgi:hypothetical protein
MRTKFLGVAVAAIIPTPSQAAVRDELCARLRAFEVAQLPKGERRWIEFHWHFGQDVASIWSWGCRHSKDQLAGTTCGRLMHHTNQEFSMELPQRIMTCHGYHFPKFAFYDWKGIEGTIELRGAIDRRVLMDLNYRDLPNGEQALRVSVGDSNGRYEPDELPPIEPMPNGPKRPSH